MLRTIFAILIITGSAGWAQAPRPSNPSGSSAGPGDSSRGLFLGVQGGGLAPLHLLRPGYTVGLELRLGLGPALEGSLRAGFLQAAFKGERLVPNRGLDPVFIQNLSAFPVELALRWRALPLGPGALLLHGGYGAVPLTTTFQALGEERQVRALGHVAIAALGYQLPLGPGEASVELLVRAGGARLGPLGEAGTESLSGAQVVFTYGVGLK